MGTIKKRVVALIKKHGTNCPFKIAKGLGIQIQFENLGSTLGYYSKHFRIPIIHINETTTEDNQKFICAHELGHAILDPDTNTSFLKAHTFFSTDKKESEANTFAVELLMPDEVLYEYENTNLSIYETCEIYGVPKEMATFKVFFKKGR
ncbi:ImmA/IrrE family metallo-endopeptidase [Schinkia azotoformans]|uniref:ImmA/IrrE family metallo-endopeptidase n=1 Tax=Schinkia azotoformans TaxID=1454 RepID=UPI002DBE972D|nr:ImmA/IrrE family metallo-endopeptidase [Schinkia azotoformans]MEC1714703.1 ImmA/IrrE family metallo-endopeptidase [Schinkia azotoformans]MEC1757541.1 ImmA/IrrE family metallo-endopeptidase [Schinkia azotoformans]